MSRTPDTPPSNYIGQELRVEDWLSSKNTREIVHINRDVNLEVVREKLNTLQPTLAMLGGFCLYSIMEESSHTKVLVTNHPKITGINNTVVSINRIDQSDSSELYFMEGRFIELLDITIPNNSRWLNTRHENIYQPHHKKSWQKPKYATLLIPEDEHLKLFGNLERGIFVPEQPKDLEQINRDANVLWQISNILDICNQLNLCENLKTVTLPK